MTIQQALADMSETFLTEYMYRGDGEWTLKMALQFLEHVTRRVVLQMLQKYSYKDPSNAIHMAIVDTVVDTIHDTLSEELGEPAN
jgi:hypothetical protein